MTVMAPEKRVIEEIHESDLSEADDEGSNHSNASNTDNESNGSNSDNEVNPTNEGWADSISKILKSNKPKGKKTLVLSRAKKLTDVKKKTVKPAGFEVETADGEVKDEEIVEENDSQEATGPPRKKKKELPNLRVKPNILEKDRERLLSKIATKGVVQLFNAVRMQQKDISNKLQEAGPLEVRKEKVMKNIDKRAFLDVLMGEKSTHIDEEPQVKKQQTTSEKDGTWSVLKDDFMMSAKMKDWDKELEQEDDEEEEAELESD